MRACVRACVRSCVRACVRAYGGKVYSTPKQMSILTRYDNHYVPT